LRGSWGGGQRRGGCESRGWQGRGGSRNDQIRRGAAGQSGEKQGGNPEEIRLISASHYSGV
jgi:hypothetical protein